MKTIMTYMIARRVMRPKTYVYLAPPESLKEIVPYWRGSDILNTDANNRNWKVKTKLSLDVVVI